MQMAIDKNAGRPQVRECEPFLPAHAGARRRSDLLGGPRVFGAELERRAINLSVIAHEVVVETQALDAVRKVEWVIAPDIKIFADAPLLRRVLQTLLGNAFMFSGDGRAARVEVGFRRIAGSRIEIFVSDNGAGTDMQDVGRLFTPMRRLRGDDAMEVVGTRLPDVRRIVEMHGGTIRADSGSSAGTTVAFELPDWSVFALGAAFPGSARGEQERDWLVQQSRVLREPVTLQVHGGGTQSNGKPGAASDAVPNAARVARLRAEAEQFRFPNWPVLLLLLVLAGVAGLKYGI